METKTIAMTMARKEKPKMPDQLSKRKEAKQGVIGYFTGHRVAPNLLMLLVIVVGVVSLFQLKTTFFPDVVTNRLTVNLLWPGANAEDVERQITTPLENKIKQLKGLDSFSSNTNAGSAYIRVSYLNTVDMVEAEQKLTQLVERFSDYPKGAEKPEVTRREFKELTAVMVVSTDGSVEDLEPYVNEFKSELLSRGIAEVQISGLRNSEIRVEVPTQNLLSLNTTVDRMASTIREKNTDLTAGTVGESFSEKAVKAKNQAEMPSEIGKMILSADQEGNFSTLGQVAEVMRKDVTGTRKVFYDNKASVRMMIFRNTEIDTIESNDILDQWVEDTKKELPVGVYIAIPYKLSQFVTDNIKLLVSNGLLGMVLVTLMLFVFLNSRVALWTAFGIPISLFGTLAFLNLTGGSLNFLSMFAMLMALGIIVDDAIVVGEESVSQLEKGLAPTDAAKKGALRMFSPVMASSLTTIAAFSPLLFLDGIQGQLFKPIPVVVISVIVASLIECFLIMPGHLNHSFLSREKKAKKPWKFRQYVDAKLFAYRDGPYRRTLTKVLENRGTTLALALAAFILSVGMVFFSIVKFNPDVEPKGAVVRAYAEFANGTSEAEIVAFSKVMEKGLYRAAEEMDSTRNVIVDHYMEYTKEDRYVWIRVTLLDRDDRPFTNEEFLEVWDKFVDREVYVEDMRISENGEESETKQSLSLFLVGDDISVLREASRELKAAIAKYPDLKNIEDNIPKSTEQIVFDLSPTGQALGISAADLSEQIRGAIDGVKVQSFVEGQNEVDLVVSLPELEKRNVNVLRFLPITTPQGTVLPLANLVTLKTGKTVESIYHDQGQVGVSVTADILNPDADIKGLSESIRENELALIRDRYGLNSEIRGSSKETDKMLKRLMISFALALVLMYVILAWVFSSYSWPIAVMSAIPMGLTGAIVGHLVMGFSMNILSIFGFFGLAGIIVNDSIVLISRYRELLEEGLSSKEAIIEAGCQRFRAVFLTSVTTVVGLIPILFETSVQAQLVQSMATSLAFGLAYGTILVLIVIPCVLSILESMKSGLGQLKHFRFRRKDAAALIITPADPPLEESPRAFG